MLTLIFNLVPVSINKLYVNLRGQSRRFMSTPGKKFKADMEKQVIDQVTNTPNGLPYLSSLKGKCLAVTIKITSPTWLLKDGKSVRVKDISSFEKVTNDSIFSAFTMLGLDLDDSQIWDLHMIKEVGPIETITYTISEYV